MKGPVQLFPIRLGEVARMWRNKLDQRLKHLGLSQARGFALLLLSQHQGALPQNELAERVGIRGSTLVRQLDRLERQGLVERREDRHDRRVKTVHLTDKAEPLVDQIEAVAQGLRREMLAEIGEAELRSCVSVLDRVKIRLADGCARSGDRKAG